MSTNIDRWKELSISGNPPSWADRNKVMVSYIIEGSTVLDVGAGNQILQTLLPNNCTYQPMDCVKGSENTIVYDFNSVDTPPILNLYDIVICSGVLEYINDPLKFLNIVKNYGKIIVLSYALYENRSTTAKRNPSINGWVNEFTIHDMNKFFDICGIKTLDSVMWNKHTIFKLSKSEEQ